MSESRRETQKAIHMADLRDDTQQPNPAADTSFNLSELPLGSMLQVQTENRTYLLENRGDGQVKIKGHPEYCPEPILVSIYGSVAGAQTPRAMLIRPGMCLVYRHPTAGLVRTSRIAEIRHFERTMSAGDRQTDS
jgi:hypothetical protein